MPNCTSETVSNPSTAKVPEYPRYFQRQLVTADDLNAGVMYTRERLRRHNSLLHGCGVICGLLVELGPEGQVLSIGSGNAIAPSGDEIIVPEDVTLNVLEDMCFMTGTGDSRRLAQWPPPEVDPCPYGDIIDQTYYLAVCYNEKQTTPVPSISGDRCGGETICEPSRVEDSFKLVLLDSIADGDCLERYDQADDPAWLGEYYQYAASNDPPVFPDVPVLVRYDPAIDFNWAGGSPDPSLNPQYFMARWTRNLYLPSGKYRFTVRTDDGVRLWIDGTLCINEWHAQPATNHHCAVKLGAGIHHIRMEFYERGGLAVAQLTWQVLKSGWLGTYYQYPAQEAPPTFPTSAPVLTRIDPDINFNWGGGSPHASLNSNYYMARWTRDLNVTAPGTYEFTVRTDDGMRLWVDDELCLDEWHAQPPTTHRCQVALGPGRHRLRVEYYERRGTGIARVCWRYISPYNPPCTPRLQNGCVILATLEARNGVFTSVDNFWFDKPMGYRRKIIPSVEMLSQQMRMGIDPGEGPHIVQIVPGSGQRGEIVSAVVFGRFLEGTTGITFSGQGVIGRVLSGGTDTWVPVEISIAEDAPTTVRSFTLITPWCPAVHSHFKGIGFTVTGAAEVPVTSEPPAGTPPVVVDTGPPVVVVTDPPIIIDTIPPVYTELLPHSWPVDFTRLDPLTDPVPFDDFFDEILDPADYPGRLASEVDGIGEVRMTRMEEKFGTTNLALVASTPAEEMAEVMGVSVVRAMAFKDEATRLLMGG